MIVLLIAVLAGTLSSRPAVAQTTEADVFVVQGILDFEEKRYDAALENLRRALEIEPAHVEALYYTGAVHLAQGRPADALPVLLRAREKSPSEPSIGFQLGLAYFALQRYEDAQPLLEQTFRIQPELDGLGYYVGFLRYRKKDYRGALETFRAGRSTDPQIQQLTRFYTGLALAVLGLPAQAAAEVEQALKLAPSSALTGPAERLRDTIVAAQGANKRLSAELKLGVFVDDNVAVIPNRDNSEPLVAQFRRAAHESPGELLGLRVDYKWYQTEDWESSVGYSFFGTYNDRLPSFNVMDNLGNVGLLRKFTVDTLPAQAGVQYAFDSLFLHDREFIRRNTATSFVALVEPDLSLGPLGTAANITQVFGRFQDKHFPPGDTPPIKPEVRSGTNWMAGFLHIVGFSQNKHLVKLGYQYDWDDTKGKDYLYHGHRLLAGAQYTLPPNWYDLRLKWDLDVHFRDYGYGSAILPSTNPGRNRQDEEVTNIIRAEWPLPERFNAHPCVGTGSDKTCVGWTLSGEYQATRAHSNVQIFDYDRNVYSLILSLTF